jgi:hypothetical protein
MGKHRSVEGLLPVNGGQANIQEIPLDQRQKAQMEATVKIVFPHRRPENELYSAEGLLKNL